LQDNYAGQGMSKNDKASNSTLDSKRRKIFNKQENKKAWYSKTGTGAG
jgi:hypothetical protein